jgi:putative hydrolase of the HAD superfamily
VDGISRRIIGAGHFCLECEVTGLNMQQQIILFDLGGVLVDLADPVTSIGLSMSDEEFWSIWLSSPLVQQFETGRLTASEFVSKFGAELGFNNADEFDRALRSWHLPLFDGAEEALQSLTESNTIALLSNINEIHWQHVESQTDVFENFAKVFLSYETGNAKPHAPAFHDVVAHFDCEPQDIVFFDDNAGNVAAAKAEGLRAVQVQGWSNVEQEIAKVL